MPVRRVTGCIVTGAFQEQLRPEIRPMPHCDAPLPSHLGSQRRVLRRLQKNPARKPSNPTSVVELELTVLTNAPPRNPSCLQRVSSSFQYSRRGRLLGPQEG